MGGQFRENYKRLRGIPQKYDDDGDISSKAEVDAAVASGGGGDVTQAELAAVSGLTDQNATDIVVVSGLTDQNALDIAALSGVSTNPDAVFDSVTVDSSNQDVILVRSESGILGIYKTLPATGTANLGDVCVDRARIGGLYLVEEAGALEGLVVRNSSDNNTTVVSARAFTGENLGLASIEMRGDAGGNLWMGSSSRINWPRKAAPGSGPIQAFNQSSLVVDSPADGQLRVRSTDTGEPSIAGSTTIAIFRQQIALSGPSVTASGLYPPGATCEAITIKVVEQASGATSINVGHAGDLDRWGSGISVNVNTSTSNEDFTADPRVWSSASGEVILSANGPDFTAGSVVITAHCMLFNGAF